MNIGKVYLNNIESIREFVSIANRICSDINLKSGRFIINAKSIMGIFSLDLSRPVELAIQDEKEFETAKVLFQKFIA